MDPVYKLLLCWKYLRTRYLAFVCIVSVMLGVATLIVVNSVMSGFSNKLRDRLQGILSDIVVESDRPDGMPEPPDQLEAKIRNSSIGQYVDVMSPTVEVMALLQFEVNTRDGDRIPIMKPVRLIGIDPEKHAAMGKFRKYLKRQKSEDKASFELTGEAKERFDRNRWLGHFDPRRAGALEIPVVPTPVVKDPVKDALFGNPAITAPERPLIPAPQIPAGPAMRIPGAFIGHSLAHYHWKDPETGESRTRALLNPGDDIFLATVGSTGTKPVSSTFTVADYFHCEMSEYDSTFIYVPLDELQKLRGMGNRVSTIQIRLKPNAVGNLELIHKTIIPELQKLFAQDPGTRVGSWQQHQGPLLEAIDTERGILNLLLFMIVGVSGFSVLAIFTMIVSEKYRDIGVLKSLGASSVGIMNIFLTYGLLLGTVGCILGTIAGLLITTYINPIENFLAYITGQQIFDRSIYYFDEIPTNIESLTVLLVNVGAVSISVVFSVLPALRAARLHPVKALRFE
jgi:lipoprotein-releasing system permease protein